MHTQKQQAKLPPTKKIQKQKEKISKLSNAPQKHL